MKKQLQLQLIRMTAACAAAAALTFALSQAAFAENIYLIRDGEEVLVHTTKLTDPEAVLADAGVSLAEADSYEVTESGGAIDVTVQRCQAVALQDGTEKSTLSTYCQTVGELLDQQGIVLGAMDTVTPGRSSAVTEGMTIQINRVRQEEALEEGKLPFETLRYEDDSLPAGEERVLSEGEKGTVRRTVTKTYKNGYLVDSQVTQETVLQEPVAQVVLCGTKEAPAKATRKTSSGTVQADENGKTITTASGDVISYSRKMSVTATAYSCEGYTGTTATGTTARYGAIAVDPTVIPYGTRMYIVSDDGAYIYGYATAEDCGGAIKGNIIDLYFDTIAECYEFGRRSCTVYILD